MTDKYAVLHIADIASPVSGTFFDSLLALGRELRRQGIGMEVCFSCPMPWHQKLVSEGVGVHILQVPPLKSFFAFFNTVKSIRSLVKQKNVKVVHCHFGMPSKLCGVFLKLTLSNVKVIWHWHGLPTSKVEKRNWIKRSLRDTFYQFVSLGVDRHVAISSQLREWLEHVAVEKTMFVPNAVALERFSVDTALPPPGQRGVADELNIRSDHFVFCTVANFRPQKDHKTLLKALQLATHKHGHCRLIFVGFGPLFDDALAFAKDLGIEDKVFFTGKRDDVEKVVACANAFVLSTFTEGFAYVLCEAMALCLPVIATRVGGCRDIVTPDVGFLVATSNPEELAKKMIWMAENPHLAREMGKKGRRMIEEHHNLDAWSRQIVEMYESYFGQKSSGEGRMT